MPKLNFLRTGYVSSDREKFTLSENKIMYTNIKCLGLEKPFPKHALFKTLDIISKQV